MHVALKSTPSLQESINKSHLLRIVLQEAAHDNRDNATMNINTRLDNQDKHNIDIGDDIPFILCSPTKNENGVTQLSQHTTSAKNGSPEPVTFSLQPRRSCHSFSLWQREEVEPTAIADTDMLSQPLLNMEDSANEFMGCKSLLSSPRSSPLPTFQSIDVMVTPPAPRPRMAYLLKRRDCQVEHHHHQGSHDDYLSPPKLTGLSFPILGRRDDHQHLWLHQRPKIHRPIPLYHQRR